MPREVFNQIPLQKALGFFINSWFQHDGQWFLKTRKRYGMEAAMEVNEAAIFSLGKIEAAKLHQLTGLHFFRNCRDFAEFWKFYFSHCFEAYYGPLDHWTEIKASNRDVFRVVFKRCIGWEMAQAARYPDIRVGKIPACQGNKSHWQGWLSAPGNEGRYTLVHQPKVTGDRLACEYTVRRKG